MCAEKQVMIEIELKNQGYRICTILL